MGDYTKNKLVVGTLPPAAEMSQPISKPHSKIKQDLYSQELIEQQWAGIGGFRLQKHDIHCCL